jgi:F0F1-type ATP synthase membrane subunit b/b'
MKFIVFGLLTSRPITMSACREPWVGKKRRKPSLNEAEAQKEEEYGQQAKEASTARSKSSFAEQNAKAKKEVEQIMAVAKKEADADMETARKELEESVNMARKEMEGHIPSISENIQKKFVRQ